MIEVHGLFVGRGFATEVWVTERVLSALTNRKKSGQLFEKLEEYAQKGFWNFEGGAIRHEWDGAYRVGLRTSLFRVIGFYESVRKDLFVGVDALRKRGQELSSADRDRIDRVADTKACGAWRKVSDD